MNSRLIQQTVGYISAFGSPISSKSTAKLSHGFENEATTLSVVALADTGNLLERLEIEVRRNVDVVPYCRILSRKATTSGARYRRRLTLLLMHRARLQPTSAPHYLV